MRKFFAGIALACMLAVGGVTACSAQSAPPMPAVWTVSYMGTNYCPYEYSQYETQMYGYQGQCTPVAFPSLSAMPLNGSLEWALMNYWTQYSDFYMSNYWYYNYYAPIGARYHVRLITYASYSSNVTIFDHTYSRQISTNRSKAVYVGKSGRTTGSYKFPSTNTKQASKIWSNSGSGAGSRTSTSVKTGGGGTAPRPPAPRAPAPRIGKPGR